MINEIEKEENVPSIDLNLIYQGNCCIYQRGEVFGILPQKTEQTQLSLQEIFNSGGSFLFCHAPNEHDAQSFSLKILAYLAKWRVWPLFLWLENPMDDIPCWIIQKIERFGARQRLLLDGYYLDIGKWQCLTVSGDEFIFYFEQNSDFCFGHGAFRLPLPDNNLSLRLLTLDKDCGAFAGTLQVAENVRSSFMEQINAGIYFSRHSESRDQQARTRGFVDYVYSPVLKLQAPTPNSSYKDTIHFKLTPHQLLDKDRSYFSLSGFDFYSLIVTRAGQPIKLQAQADSYLVFQKRPILFYKENTNTPYAQTTLHSRTSLYLGLSGSFRQNLVHSSKPSKKQTQDNKHLLCGLAGTETLTLQEAACLSFCPSMPAVEPYVDSFLGTTSWIGGVGGGSYYCQPKQSVLYGQNDQAKHDTIQTLRMLDIPAASFAERIPYVPMLPHLGLVLKGDHSEIMWEETLYQLRYAKLINDSANIILMANDGICAVMPQGLMANVCQDGHYNWLGVATFQDTKLGDVPDLYFSNIDHNAQSVLQQQQILYVIDKAKIKTLDPNKGFCFTLDKVQFDLRPESWRENCAQPTLMVMQYSATHKMQDALKDNPTFQSACQAAYTENGQLREGYEPFIEAITDPSFEGIIVLNINVVLSKLPSEVQFLMNTVDKSQFYASYLVIKAGKILSNNDGQTILKASSFDGLINYVSDSHLNYISEPPDYDYLTTEIRIRIQDNRMVSFFSSSEVLVNRLFDAKVQAYDNPDGNCLILQGQMVEKDQTKVFQYSLKHEVTYNLKGSGFNTVLVNRVDLITEQNGFGQFQLAGVLSSNALEGADILGFGGDTAQQGLPFSQLILLMQPRAQGHTNQFSVNYGQLILYQDKATLRDESFPLNFAVRLESIILEQNGETPEQKGYIAIDAPIQQGIPPNSYQGLVWTISIGSLGGLSNQGLIQLRLLTAFWEGEDGNPEYYLGIQIPGTGGMDAWKLQGLFKLSFDSVSIRKKDSSYTILLHGFQIQILGASFPEVNSNIVLFSDGRKIGWYSAYKEK